MAKFECRHIEWHDDDDWCEVDAYDANSAACKFAELMDSKDSEAFLRPDQDVHTFLVKKSGDQSCEADAFIVSFDYYKSFRARGEYRKQTT